MHGVIKQTEHQRVILKNYGEGLNFQSSYNNMLLGISSAAFIQEAQDFLTSVEPMLTPLLMADPNSKVRVVTYLVFVKCFTRSVRMVRSQAIMVYLLKLTLF
jgi:hypothetical protein